MKNALAVRLPAGGTIYIGAAAQLQATDGLFTHDSSYAQTDAAVSVTLDLGDGMVATGPGAVAVAGQLQLQAARAMPQDPNITVDVENLQFRSDAPWESLQQKLTRR
jgi:hypothetical protein